MPESEIWEIGNTIVAPHRGPILARADFNSLVAYDVGLKIEPTIHPHRRHVDVLGWDAEKAKNKFRVLKLADKSVLVEA
jgi:hypothetical protein